nr:MAG TPA: hypothetical protein [Caudoviricetes sp.]
MFGVLLQKSPHNCGLHSDITIHIGDLQYEYEYWCQA